MSRVDQSPTPPFEVRVHSIGSVADGVVELVLVAPDGRRLPEWEPGAHIDLLLPNGLVRQYSLASDPADLGHYRVGVLREPAGGGGSQFIHDELRVGDVLSCQGPRNNFPLAPAKSYRFIAGGIGITPLLPMVESAELAEVPWRLTYLGRTKKSMAWAEHLAERFPDRVDVRPDDVFGAPDVAAVLAGLTDGELVYACGPHGLLDALADHLGDRKRGMLHLERFSPADAEALTSGGHAFRVTLDRSGVELDVPAGKSILQVMEEHGIPVVSSCREGTCGTCETAVLAGEVDHRDSILSDEERAENETMMICCSRGLGPGLVIDA